MSNATSTVTQCPHDRYGYQDCEACAEDTVASYIERRVAEDPTLLASAVLDEIRAGKVHAISPEQQEANIAAWKERLSPAARALMDEE